MAILEGIQPQEGIIVAGLFGNLFGKKQDPTPDFSPLVCDLHSHLLPAVDDGSQDVATSLEMIRGMQKIGFRKFITTPHIMSDGFPNTPQKLQPKLEKLREAIHNEGWEVELELAAEYYLDEAFEAMIPAEPLLTFGGKKKYVLFETSYVARPLSLESVIFKLNSYGYTPVLAHPERYNYFWEENDIERIRDLAEMGAKLQVNISSFAGNYSKRAAKIAAKLVDEDLVDFIGSDLHKPRQLEGLAQAWTAGPKLARLVQSGRLLNATL